MATITEITDVEKIEKGQLVSFIIRVGGKDYDWRSLVPHGEAPRAYLEAELDKHVLLILRRRYPGAVIGAPTSADDRSELQWLRDWITAGAINPAVIDDAGNEITPEIVVTPVPWRSTHPPAVAFRKAYRAATTDRQRIKILARAVLNLIE